MARPWPPRKSPGLPLADRDGIAGLAMVRVFIAALIVLTELAFAYFSQFGSVEVLLSSLAVTCALLLQLRFGIRGNAETPADIVVFIFNWMFLDFAPKVQLLSLATELVNTSPVNLQRVALTDLLCAFFIVSFTAVYYWSDKAQRRFAGRGAGTANSPVVGAGLSVGDKASERADRAKGSARRTGTASPAVVVPLRPLAPFGVAVSVAVCLAAVALAAPYAYHSIGASDAGDPVHLIISRFILFLPAATLLILLNESLSLPKKLAFSRIVLLLVLFVLVVVTKNSYTEKRNALGPLYIAMILVLFNRGLYGQPRRFILLVCSMVLAFPAISVFTHIDRRLDAGQILSTIDWKTVTERIEGHYFSVDYDAWANIYTAVEIVARGGIHWGHQLLGTLLFFVPSSIWTTKPMPTGSFIGRYLMEHHGMWFDNLSAPLVAEGYIDFGLAGVIGYAAVLAGLVAFLNVLARKWRSWAAMPLALYLSIGLMFLMRGAMMVAVAYISGAIVAFVVASWITSLGTPAPPRPRAGGEPARALARPPI